MDEGLWRIVWTIKAGTPPLVGRYVDETVARGDLEFIKSLQGKGEAHLEHFNGTVWKEVRS